MVENFKEIREALAADITDWRETVYITNNKDLAHFKALVYSYGVLSQVHKNEKDLEVDERLKLLEAEVFGNELNKRQADAKT